MKDYLRRLLPHQHPLRLLYHKWMAILAALLYGFPANKMTVIGVTGTNGKTTTSNIIHRIFMEAGQKAGLITTVNFKVGETEEVNETKMSSLSPFLMQKKLRQMQKAGCKVVVLEATSHALVQSRLWGVNVDTALFTNLTRDHLDYHGTMEEYRNAKGLLFAGLNPAPRKSGVQKISVINRDDPEAEYFAKFPVDQLFEFGIQNGAYVARNLESDPGGTRFTLRIPNGEEQIDFRIPGRMNVYNALAAATVASAHGINIQVIKKALESMRPVPGRLEVIDEGQPYTVVVDYAHAEDALRELLSMFKELTTGQLIVVFGACGDRDQKKRPGMGAIAHEFADVVILTNDDLYSETGESIAAMVRAGIPRKEGEGFWQVLDRREAIRLALSLAKEGDTVIVAGKGAEVFQVIGKRKILHDDRVVVRELLARDIDVVLPSA